VFVEVDVQILTARSLTGELLPHNHVVFSGVAAGAHALATFVSIPVGYINLFY
jgi:hypothetical protein